MVDPNAVLRETFSYVEPCLRAWESSRSLRKLGINGESLAVGEDTNGVIPPTLQNVKANYTLLKAYTQHMANTGVIITKLIGYIQPPVVKFYELMEIDVTTHEAKALAYGASFVIKKMLHVIRRKWARWEMPRVTRWITSVQFWGLNSFSHWANGFYNLESTLFYFVLHVSSQHP